MKKFYRILIALTLFICFVNIVQAQAENVNFEKFIFSAPNVISSAGGGQFHYSKENISVFGKLLDGNFGPGLSSRESGTPLPLNFTFSGLSIKGGNSGLVNGELYERLYFSGTLSVSVPVNFILHYRYNRSKFKVTFPATLTGLLKVHSEEITSTTNPPTIFTTNLNLQGKVIVTLEVRNLLSGPNGTTRAYYKVDVRYEFPSNQDD